MQFLSDVFTPILVILLALIAAGGVSHKFGLFERFAKSKIQKQSSELVATMDRNVAERKARRGR